jgi:glycosyltransferase involved in cell wall biosynthesis
MNLQTRQAADLTPGVSVVICAYTLARWPDLVNAVTSVERQQTGGRVQLVVVIDHAPALLRAATHRWPAHTVIPSDQPQGLSGARNTGLAAAKHEITAFLDDDAAAQDDWLQALTAEYQDDGVIGVGGRIDPAWQGQAPAWFPPEFLWVLGCSYTGLPETAGTVRNVIGANMSVRTEVALAAGGFRLSLGRAGPFPLGGEETEFCVRSAQQYPGTNWIYQPDARVTHQVTPERQRRRYFLKRCFAEGLTKANVARHTGEVLALASERAYLRRTLPAGILRRLWRPTRASLSQVAAIVIGTAATATGYLIGKGIRAEQGAAVSPAVLSTSMSSVQPETFVPFLMVDLDLGAPIGDLQLRGTEVSGRARVLCSLHQVPLGQLDVDLPAGGLRATDLAAQIWQALAAQINAHLRGDHLPELQTLSEHGVVTLTTPECEVERQAFLSRAPQISVIVATRNRAQKLPALLDLLLDLDYPEYELLIVDNAPENDETRAVVEARAASDPRVRYVREDRPGLSSARNAGARQARAELIAVTDDDVRPVRGWLRELARGFETGENVGCVTGAILAARLDTRAQLWTEQYGGFHKGFAPRLFGLHEHRDDSRMYPYNAGIFGSGANLAFRRAAFLQAGGFDPCLGAGSKGMGGEELAVFVQLLSAGYRIAYQPGALLYHDHHADEESLRKQMYSYGAGLSAYLTKTLWDRPGRILDFARRVPAGLVHLLHRDSPKNRQKDADYPAELTRLEQRGLLHGPLGYVRARSEQRRASRR